MSQLSEKMEFVITALTYAQFRQAFNLELKLRLDKYWAQSDQLAAHAELRRTFTSVFHGQRLQIFGGFVAVKFFLGSILMPGRVEKIYRP
jgi:hypothetical protein